MWHGKPGTTGTVAFPGSVGRAMWSLALWGRLPILSEACLVCCLEVSMLWLRVVRSSGLEPLTGYVTVGPSLTLSASALLSVKWHDDVVPGRLLGGVNKCVRACRTLTTMPATQQAPVNCCCRHHCFPVSLLPLLPLPPAVIARNMWNRGKNTGGKGSWRCRPPPPCLQRVELCSSQSIFDAVRCGCWLSVKEAQGVARSLPLRDTGAAPALSHTPKRPLDLGAVLRIAPCPAGWGPPLWQF